MSTEPKVALGKLASKVLPKLRRLRQRALEAGDIRDGTESVFRTELAPNCSPADLHHAGFRTRRDSRRVRYWADRYDAYSSEARAMLERDRFLETLTRCGLSSSQVETVVDRLISDTVGHRSGALELPSPRVVRQRLLASLHSEAVEYTSQAWIMGVRTASSALRLGTGAILRAPEVGDVTGIVSESWPGFSDFRRFGAVPDSILELRYVLGAEGAINVKADRWAVMLSLAFPVQVRVDNQRIECQSYLGMSCTSGGPMSYSRSPPIVIAEESRIRRLTRALWTHIPDSVRFSALPGTLRPAGVALARYFDSLNPSLPPESRIASAMSAIEALMITGSTGELTFRLSLMTGLLMELLGRDGLAARESLRSAYSVRSRFVHGDEVKGSQATLKELCEEVCEMTRIVVVVFLQVLQSTTKAAFLDQIERASVRDSCRTDLSRTLAGVLT